MDASHLAPTSAQHVPVKDSKGPSSQEFFTRPSTPVMTPAAPNTDLSRRPRKLVLCFDGTGNKFHGDDSDSNILKIFRMLDRTASDQYHYYQPGIGTYVVSGSLTHTGLSARVKSWYQKAKDSAIGSSFDQHVVGGYRFLMRFYNPGDEIYMFGFSRGAYIARFLAEMLDYIGLLSHGNEEMVKFAWKAFAEWQAREQASGSSGDEAESSRLKREEMFRFMKGFRETFSRPVGRIRFLGLFDTVNSVPRFEAAWMQRSKFPYTARSSAKVIRHAVSIDERRAKFRQDLMYQNHPARDSKRHRHFGEFLDDLRDGMVFKEDGTKSVPPEGVERGRRRQSHLKPDAKPAASRTSGEYGPYRARSKSSQRSVSRQRPDVDTDAISNISGIPISDIDPEDESQDIDEVWFSGGHADVGGGWEMLEESKSASHIPLVWMVREAIRAGLPFDEEKVHEMGCAAAEEFHEIADGNNGNATLNEKDIPDIRLTNGGGSSRTPTMPSFRSDAKTESGHPEGSFHDIMHRACNAKIHDSLEYGQGLGAIAVTAWKFMEYLPFRRMDLQPDGSWKPIRWPLPCGEVRDIPDAVRVHGSVIRRMNMDENYRPGNLIIGGGGRGVRVAGKEHGVGEWVCIENEGDPVGEIWVRKLKETGELLQPTL